MLRHLSRIFRRHTGRALVFASLALPGSVTFASSYVPKPIARVPMPPNSAQGVRLWFDSNTDNGENVYVETLISGVFTEHKGNYNSGGYPGANWYVDLPAYPAGTAVGYQVYLRYEEQTNKYFASGFIYDYTVTDPSVSAGAAVHSAPAVWSGKAYFGSDDGKLYGYDIASKTALSGFPYDATANAGAGAKILGRPSLRGIGGEVYLFFLTDNGYVFRLHLNSDGSLETSTSPPVSYRPDSSASGVSTTPVVIPVGATDYIFAAMNTSSGARLFKIPALTMDSHSSYAFGSGTTITSSPAGGVGPDVYVGVGVADSSAYGVVRVQASDLTPRASFAPGETVSGSPFISGTSAFNLPAPVMYIGTDSGNIYAVNAQNGNSVGSAATVASGQRLTSVFLYDLNVWTSGATNGEIYRVSVNTNTGALGTVTNWYNVKNETNGYVPAGLAVDPKVGGKDYLVFGTDNGWFYRIDTSNANQKTIYRLGSGSAFLTTPGVDVQSGQVVAGNADGKVYIYPR